MSLSPRWEHRHGKDKGSFQSFAITEQETEKEGCSKPCIGSKASLHSGLSHLMIPKLFVQLESLEDAKTDPNIMPTSWQGIGDGAKLGNFIPRLTLRPTPNTALAAFLMLELVFLVNGSLLL